MDSPTTSKPRQTPRNPGDWAAHAPQTLRALVRADEVWLAALAAAVGVLAGLGVALINIATGFMHRQLFGLAAGHGLSASGYIAPARAFLVPTLGGLALGVFGLALSRFRPNNLIDAVEANALYGGRMSLSDSVIVAGQTTWSNGVGASVGLEAGYAQLGAGIASRIGRSFKLRRNDLRVLVGCGAAAAIGGAFNAPLCGAFYGIELIIGVYSITTLPFVVIASLAGTLTVQALIGGSPPLNVTLPPSVPGDFYPIVLILGFTSGLAGIAIMRGVTLIEAGFRRSFIPIWLRPVFGGAVVGLLGCIVPSAMSSGHSALHADIDLTYPFLVVLEMLVFKAVASAFSIGAGFRGGLFFASLFLGALFGKVFAGIVSILPFVTPMPTGLYAVIGMSALAVSIVGGPMTMTFLALESTQNFAVTMAVLAASITATLTVRRLFGYSFATWRFHLRGEPIRSAVDIGWIKSLTVERMMNPVQHKVAQDIKLEAFRQDFPLSAAQFVIVLDAEQKYAGIAYPAEAFGLAEAGAELAEILHHRQHYLLPKMTVKEAGAVFEAAEADALAVLDDASSRCVMGVLTEQATLRRYNEELERRRRDLSGE